MEEPQAPGSTSGGARCALHYGQPFTAVCQRCGTYMCQSCTDGGKFNVCPSCRSRTGLGSFPLRRDGFTWGQLTRFAWDVYKRNWALLLVATIVVFAVAALFQGLSLVVQFALMDQISLMLMIQAALVVPQSLISALLGMGVLNVTLKLVRGEPASLGMLFSAWPRLGAFLLQALIVFAVLLPVFALASVPFFMSIFSVVSGSDVTAALSLLTLPLGFIASAYIFFGLAFGGIEVVAQPNVGAVDALRNSWSIARGQRLAILLGGIIGVGTVILGLFACLIGTLFAYGFAFVLFATIYLTLRNGAEGLVA